MIRVQEKYFFDALKESTALPRLWALLMLNHQGQKVWTLLSVRLRTFFICTICFEVGGWSFESVWHHVSKKHPGLLAILSNIIFEILLIKQIPDVPDLTTRLVKLIN